MANRERGSWEKLALQMKIMDVNMLDTYRKIGKKIQPLQRRKPIPVWAQLDRFYIDADLHKVRDRHVK